MKRIIKAGLIIGIVVLLLGISYTTWVVWEVYDSTRAMQALLISSAIYDDDQLITMMSRLTSATQRAFNFGYSFHDIITLWGVDGCAMNHLLRVGKELSSVTGELVPLSPDVRDLVFTAAEGGEIYLANIRETLTSKPISVYHQQLAVIPSSLEACPTAHPQWRKYLDISDSLLYMAQFATAAPWDRLINPTTRWLFILNNSDELRASGGYITAVLEVYIDSNDRLTWRFMNSFTVDEDLESSDATLRPPEPMERYMGFGTWLFRDGNWSPDFPTAAHMLRRMYARGQQTTPPDFIVNVSLIGLETIARYLPVFEVENMFFSPDTALDVIRTAWNEDAAIMNSYVPNRKDFLLDTAEQIGQGIANNISVPQIARLGLGLQQLLERRDIMFYAYDEQLQSVFRAQGWDGSMRGGEGDYLMIVESNLGYNKVTPKVTRYLTYGVNLEDMPTAEVDLVYRNTNLAGLDCTRFNRDPADGSVATYSYRMEGCYWNYLRIFFPPQSRISGYTAQEIPAKWFEFSPAYQPARIHAQQEAGIPGMGMMLVIPRGESINPTLSYHLPPNIITINGDDTATYRLLVQGQAGMQPTPFEIRIKLPDNAFIIDVVPQVTRVEGKTLIFQDILRGKDWHLTITYQQ